MFYMVYLMFSVKITNNYINKCYLILDITINVLFFSIIINLF